MSVVKPALIPEQLREGKKNPKLFIVPVERRCDPKGRFEMVDRLPRLTLGMTYFPKDVATLVGQ